MDSHLIEDPPNNDPKKPWMQEDVCLSLQICNYIDSEVIGLISYYEFLKELMDYLDFLYSGKGNITRKFDV